MKLCTYFIFSISFWVIVCKSCSKLVLLFFRMCSNFNWWFWGCEITKIPSKLWQQHWLYMANWTQCWQVHWNWISQLWFGTSLQLQVSPLFFLIISIRISKRMSWKESAIFFSNLAYLAHIRKITQPIYISLFHVTLELSLNCIMSLKEVNWKMVFSTYIVTKLQVFSKFKFAISRLCFWL